MNAITPRSPLKLGALVVVTCLMIILATAQRAGAYAVGLSDEMLITGVGGAPVLFDMFLPEGGGGPGSEGSLLFTPPGSGLPAVLPPGALIGLGLAVPMPGVDYVILLEPLGEPLDPLELPPPVWIDRNGHDFYVSDVLVNGLRNDAGLPPFIAFVSDNNPDLAAIVAFLPPDTPYLFETGTLQDLTPLMLYTYLAGFGPIEVRVVSDASVPEPSTFGLAALGGLAMLVYRRRRR